MDDVEALAREGRAVARLVDGDGAPMLALCVVAPVAEPAEAGQSLLDQLRERSSRTAVRALGRDEGYRIEDALSVSVAAPDVPRAEALARWLERRIGRAVVPSVGPAVALAARLSARIGRAPHRARYVREADGRVRVEAFELHVAEHCNLRCGNCCNLSPIVPDEMLSLDAVRALVTRMAGVLHADVLKIMGGEPLLHPDIAEVIGILRASRLGDRVRLFTNGLLLGRMSDAFWESLDELTISDYASAPVRPHVLAMARERARRHDFVLNVKHVTEFTQVLSPRFAHDDEAVRRTFERCWLRHRCLVARRGRFYVCTRAAYGDEFLAHAAHEPAPGALDRSGDGIDLDAPDLAAAIESALNRTTPLGACRYCFGGDGATEPHYQLTGAEVRRGLLSRRLPVA